MDRRSFLLGSGLTAAGLIGTWVGQPRRADAAEIPDRSTLASQESIRSCRPLDPLVALMEGNERFAKAWQEENAAPNMAARAMAMAGVWTDTCFLPADLLANDQAPWAAILSCADSRVSPEWVFDAAPSDLFVIRSAGNTAFDDAVASLEYSVGVLDTPLIMVMGHSGCGAVKAARNAAPLTPLLEQLVTPIRDSIRSGEDLKAAIKANARSASQQLTQRSTVLAKAVQNNQLSIVVSYFDIQSGTVTLI